MGGGKRANIFPLLISDKQPMEPRASFRETFKKLSVNNGPQFQPTRFCLTRPLRVLCWGSGAKFSLQKGKKKRKEEGEKTMVLISGTEYNGQSHNSLVKFPPVKRNTQSVSDQDE